MNRDELARMASRREKLLVTWLQRITREVISPKMADAEAHASKALTDALKAKPDGRPTIRHARQSPSYQAALNRLTEMLVALAGSGRSSTRGLIREAREECLTQGMTWWQPFIPVELRRSQLAPLLAERAAARTIILHGKDLYDELSGALDPGRRNLLAVLTRAGRKGTAKATGTDLVKQWKRQTQDAMENAVSRSLSDSEVRLNTLAGRALVRPEFLDDSPLDAGD